MEILMLKQNLLTGSGFNPIQLPWKINYGDEFKFEGREDWSYMVKNIYAPDRKWIWKNIPNRIY
jgi:hypothetical protein